jgi:hypothetical protein
MSTFGSGSITVTLPDASASAWYTAPGTGGVPPGKVRVLRLKRRDATSGSTVTVQGGTYSSGTQQTIDGATTKTMGARATFAVVSDGVNWQLID